MAFTESTNLIGNSNSQKNGQKVLFADGNLFVSGYNNSDVNIYRMANNDFEFVSTLGTGYSSSDHFGKDIKMWDGNLYISVPDSSTPKIAIFNGLNFSTNSANLVSPSSSGEGFGNSIDVNSFFVAVGSPLYDSNRGAVYIYNIDNEWSGSITNDYVIVPSFSETEDFFGASIALKDNIVLIGCPGYNNNRGAVYIFEKNDDGTWEESSRFFASDGSSGDQFGCSMSLSGDYLAVGAEYADMESGEVNAGAVYIFKYLASSGTWHQIKKINGIDEDTFEGNHFGHSVSLNGDYLAIGSPQARDEGVVDIFSKKRNWEHVIKTSSLVTSGESFGESVCIYHPYLFVGSPEYSNTPYTDQGRVFIYKDPPVHFRLAQEFLADSVVPSKASLYLKKLGNNISKYWEVFSDIDLVIDASNFKDILQGEDKYIFSDQINGFTGNGYIYLERNDNEDYGIIEYPIKALDIDTFKVWVRFNSIESSDFKADLLFDSVVVSSVDCVVDNPSDPDWSWCSFDLVIPDNNQHNLGIRIKEKGCAIDKIYITSGDAVPKGEGPSNSVSPYLTVHLQVYESDGNQPSTPLFIYDYKNSINEIVVDDWYNFNIKVLDDYHGYLDASQFSGSYFMVLSESGSTLDHFILWQMEENDEYYNLLSAFRI